VTMLVLTFGWESAYAFAAGWRAWSTHTVSLPVASGAAAAELEGARL